MSLVEHMRTLGRGPGRARSLTRAEARDAMQHMLSGDAAPEAIGALLMLLRMKGETAEEIAGFATASRDALPLTPPVALDWPSYAAGRTRGLPWFLLSARLVASAGYPVLLHGWNGPDGAVRAGLPAAGITTARSLCEADRLVARDRIAYLPLETLCPSLFSLLGLRDVLGLRSCINTVCRMLDPGRAGVSVQGVFHPSYRLLQADAARTMGWRALSVIKGGGGEVERHPGKPVAAFGVRDGAPWEATFSPLRADGRRLAEGPAPGVTLAALWRGARTDAFAEAVVIGTAAIALDTLGVPRPEHAARDLWRDRHTISAQEIPA
jgi:anthranilate phosphoribosyltransferase